MKRRIHRWLLGLMLLLLTPGTLFACLLLLGAIGSGIQHGFPASDLPGALILVIPPLLLCWGLCLQLGLRQGVHKTIRLKLLAFYLAVFAYCASWLFNPISHDDVQIMIFSTRDKIIGSTILILPILITLFSRPEEKLTWNPQVGGPVRHNGSSDRFVAWLASRIR